MADKYWLVTHRGHYKKHFLPATPTTGGGLSILRDTQKDIATFNEQVDRIRNDAITTSGVRPEFVNHKPYDGFDNGDGNVILCWCLFEAGAAVTFAMLVSGELTEHEWPLVVANLSEEEKLVQFFEIVVADSW